MQQPAARTRKRPASRDPSVERPSSRSTPGEAAVTTTATVPPASVLPCQPQSPKPADKAQQTPPEDNHQHPTTTAPTTTDPKGHTNAGEADENAENHGHTQIRSLTDVPLDTSANALQSSTAPRAADGSSAADTTTTASAVPPAVAPPRAAAHVFPVAELYASTAPATIDSGTGIAHPVSVKQAAFLSSLVEDGNVSWNDVLWQACNAAAEEHSDASFTADHAFDILRERARGKLESIILERAAGEQKPDLHTLPGADKLGQAGRIAAPAARPQIAQLGGAGAARAVTAWGNPSEGMRAVGTGSPSPAVTPPPVMQRQGPAEDRGLIARLGGSRPGGARGMGGDGETEEARLRDAAEVLMSLVKQPGGMGGFGSVGLERGEAEQSDVEGGLPQHENSAAAGATAKATAATTFAPAGSRPPVSAGATASPPVSPSNTQQGGVGPEDLEGMGLEMDESGRRISQRRRRPNMRIHDELEPSEREKAWGKGRGRRSKTTATPPIPPPSNGFRPRAPQGRGRSNVAGQEDGGDGSNSADMRDAAAALTDNDRPPEGCTTLSLDLLRQLRERGGTLTGLELIVHADSGDWLKARVQKCDTDFRKYVRPTTQKPDHVQVVVKYNQTHHLETLNWHNKDTGARVVVPINTDAQPGYPTRPGPAGIPRAGVSPSRPAASAGAMAHPASAAPDGNLADPLSAAAHSSRLQQQMLPYGLSPRVNLLSNMNFNWQAQAAIMRQRQQQLAQGIGQGVPQGMVQPQLGAGLSSLPPQSQGQALSVAVAAAGSTNNISPAMMQQLMHHMQENGNHHQVAALLAAVSQQPGLRQAKQQPAPAPAPAATAAAAAAAASAQVPAAAGGFAGGPMGPVQLEASMFPHLYDHLRSGLQQVLSKVTLNSGGADQTVRMGKLARADAVANGIVCEFTDQVEPKSLTITQKDLEDVKLSVECIRVLETPASTGGGRGMGL